MIVIGFPSGNNVKVDFAISLANLMAVCAKRNREIVFCNPRSQILPECRNQVVKTAQLNGASHVLWIDSDIDFPPDFLEALLLWNLPVVGCTHRRRRPPYTLAHEELDQPDTDDIAKVKYLPGGCLLVKTEVYNQIAMPVYEFEGQLGEDYLFCRKAQNAGFDIYLDRQLSSYIGHTGDVRFAV